MFFFDTVMSRKPCVENDFSHECYKRKLENEELCEEGGLKSLRRRDADWVLHSNKLLESRVGSHGFVDN